MNAFKNSIWELQVKSTSLGYHSPWINWVEGESREWAKSEEQMEPKKHHQPQVQNQDIY